MTVEELSQVTMDRDFMKLRDALLARLGSSHEEERPDEYIKGITECVTIANNQMKAKGAWKALL